MYTCTTVAYKNVPTYTRYLLYILLAFPTDCLNFGNNRKCIFGLYYFGHFLDGCALFPDDSEIVTNDRPFCFVTVPQEETSYHEQDYTRCDDHCPRDDREL